YVQQLLWDGKDIGVESQYLSFKHYFHSEIEAVILVELCSGGSGCPYEHILISNVGETEIKISEAFRYCILPAVIRESNETITIVLNNNRGRRIERVRYKNGKILGNGKPIKQRTVSE